MRVLVLGGLGMLGHRVWLELRDKCETVVAVRARPSDMLMRDMFRERCLITGVDARDPDALSSVFAQVRPEAVVNCVGIVKQREDAKDPVQSLTINSLLPHRLLHLCDVVGARMIHISTDCVFSGRQGSYTETDEPDAQDLYGRTKLLGEVGSRALTIRTSMIGRELRGASGLVEWFLEQPGPFVRGYTHARFSGLTTAALARTIRDVLLTHPTLTGVYHVAAAPVDKHALLVLLRDAFGRLIKIDPVSEPVIDRSLNGSRFSAATGFAAPSWPAMLAELASESAHYERWRTTHEP